LLLTLIALHFCGEIVPLSKSGLEPHVFGDI